MRKRVRREKRDGDKRGRKRTRSGEDDRGTNSRGDKRMCHSSKSGAAISRRAERMRGKSVCVER